jgi:uncharacterized membrane protein YqjE
VSTEVPTTSLSAETISASAQKEAIPLSSTATADWASKSTGDLLKDLSSQVTHLVHDEVALAKAEMTEKAAKLGAGAGMLGGAAVFGIFALAALIAAAIAALSGVLSIWAAALIVAGCLTLVAGVLALSGKSEVKQGSPPVPKAAITSTKEDVKWLKIQAQSAKP